MNKFFVIVAMGILSAIPAFAETSANPLWRVHAGAGYFFDNDDYWVAKIGVDRFITENMGIGVHVGRQQRRDSGGWLNLIGADGLYRLYSGNPIQFLGQTEILSTLGVVLAQELVYQSATLNVQPETVIIPMLGVRIHQHLTEVVGVSLSAKVWPRAFDQFKTMADFSITLSI